ADISQVEHKNIEVNGVRLHLAQQGQGPLVVLLHGFPESWYSWRHQFLPLAKAGYRVVAPDQRGYARSERPEAVEEYTLPHLVGDVVALVRALGESQAVVDRKSTRLNSSHVSISYAVFCLKKKNNS